MSAGPTGGLDYFGPESISTTTLSYIRIVEALVNTGLRQDFDINRRGMLQLRDREASQLLTFIQAVRIGSLVLCGERERLTTEVLA